MEHKRDIPRRDFLRFAGVAATGTAYSSVASPAQAGIGKLVFKETERLGVSVENPSALAVSNDASIYVAGENRVEVFDPQHRKKSDFEVAGRPTCLAILADGKVLAGLRNHLELFEPNGARAAVWQDFGDRSYLTSIAADEDDIFVADAGNRVVLRFAPDGTLRNRIGERDRDKGIPGFSIPSPYFDVALDPMGALWAVNCGKHGLENYRPNGELVSSWYRSGMEPEAFCGCCNPIHIAFRSDSTLVTIEKGINRVKVYSPDTRLMAVVVSEDPPPIQDNKAMFRNVEPPMVDLAVDARDRILVLDKQARAVIVFEEEKQQ